MQNRLKQVREDKGVSISELARKSGVSRQTIYNIEMDENASVRSSTMESLAQALEEKPRTIFLL